MLVTDWGLVSACEGPPLRVLRRVLSTNPAEKGPDLGMMGARSVNRRHFRLSMLSFEAEAAVQAEPVPPVLPVLYLDDVMCAVMKPEKLLVHRTEIANGDTVFAVQCVREQLGRRVWPVHRLDRGTSGVLVFACDADTASRLGRIMMAGEVKKRYAAVVRGWLEESVDCRHPLSLPEDPYLKKRRGPSEPQDARTVFIERARGEAPVPSGRFETTRLGLVEAELFTGRRHQIRRHLKWLAHPVIGDATYGKGPLNRASALQHRRQARHDVQCQRRQVRPLRRRRPAGHPPPQRPRRNPRLHRPSRPRVRLIRARDAPQSRRFRSDRRLFYIHCILPAQGCVTSCFGPQPSSARRTRNGVS